MGSSVFRIVLAGFLVASVQQTASAAESGLIRDISFALPDEVILSYKFPGPLKFARVALRSSRIGVEALKITFGNGKKVEIPANFLKCFKGSRAGASYLLLLRPDQRYPTKRDGWWAAVALPFGEVQPSAQPNADAGGSANNMFPYVQFVISNWKLNVVVVQSSSEKSERISLPITVCPAF
jgi:hypothetical protein